MYRFIQSCSIMFFLLCVASASFAGKNDKIPVKITQELDAMFPDKKEVAWTKHHHRYQANFIYQNCSVSITFDSDGEIVKSIEEIDFQSLPDKIIKSVLKDFNNFKRLVVLQLCHKGRTHYEIEIMKGDLHYILNFNIKGYLVHLYNVDKTDLSDISINYLSDISIN
jgi:hypothetical protein